MANWWDSAPVVGQTQTEQWWTQAPLANTGAQVADIAQSFGSGVLRGIPETVEFLGAATATLPSAAISAARGNYQGLGQEFRGLMQQAPISPAINAVVGEPYQPQTEAGRYARAIGAGAATGVIGRLPGVVSGMVGGAGAEAGGDVAAATAGEEYRPVGGLIGGLAGGLATYRYAAAPIARGVSKPTTPVAVAASDAAPGNIALSSTKIEEIPQLTPVRTALEGQRFGVSDVEKSGELQNLIKGRYAASERLEGALWNKVRDQSAKASIPPSNIKGLQSTLMDAQSTLTSNEAAGIVDRQLAMINRFVESGENIPANLLIGMRRTLSKASQKEGGLRGAVNQLDEYIAQNIDVPALKPAIDASRQQFSTFQNPKSVAKAIEEGTTASEFSRTLFQAGNPALARGAARSFDEALRAVGPRKAAEAQRLLDEATVNRIFEVARNQGSDNEFWIGKIAEQVGAVRNKNPELWNRLTPQTREVLGRMEERLRAEGQAGLLNKAGETLLNQFVGLPARAIGLRTNLQLPSTLAPKRIADIDDIVRYADIPQGILQRASGLARNVADEVGGQVSRDIGGVVGLLKPNPQTRVRIPVTPTRSR